MPQVSAYVGVGANLGNARETVLQAISQLSRLSNTRLCRQSSLFCTTPIDAGGGDFVNAVAYIETELAAHELLQELQAIETGFGRQRPYVNAPRTLDLDILLYGNRQINTNTLVVPHPRLTQRAFALIPLLQIEPMIAIPGKGPAHQFVPGVAGQAIARLDG